MKDDELFDEFYAKLKDIVNSIFNLTEIIPEPKIMRKVLRSLPERFHAKITVIEKSKDIDKIPLTEMVGLLSHLSFFSFNRRLEYYFIAFNFCFSCYFLCDLKFMNKMQFFVYHDF